MADYRGIAALTWLLRSRIDEAVRSAIHGVDVAINVGRPTTDLAAKKQPPLINIYLYHVAPHPNLRNVELPLRRSDGSLVHVPQLPLELSYLFSFLGEPVEGGQMAQFMPEVLLGIVTSYLHTQPMSRASDLPETGADLAEHYQFARSGLRDEVSNISFTPVPLNTEEMSKLWSVFQGIPYPISVVYRASPLVLSPDVEVRPSLPVRRTPQLSVSPHMVPALVSISPQLFAFGDDIDMEITGTSLAGDGLFVRLEDMVVKPVRQSATSMLVRITQSDFVGSRVQVGVSKVRVFRQGANGDPDDERRMASNPLSVVLSPRIAAARFDGATSRVVVDLEPRLGPEQRARLLLDRLGPDAGSPRAGFSLEPLPGEQLEVEQPSMFETLQFDTVPSGPSDGASGDTERVASGTYSVRVEVDGWASAVEPSTDSTPAPASRTITIP